MPTLEQLQPDLIVTQALCEVCAVAEAEVTAAACTLPGQPKVLNLEPICLMSWATCGWSLGRRVRNPEERLPFNGCNGESTP